MLVDDEDPEALEIVMPGGGQGQPISDAGSLLVWAGNHIKREREIAELLVIGPTTARSLSRGKGGTPGGVCPRPGTRPSVGL